MVDMWSSRLQVRICESRLTKGGKGLLVQLHQVPGFRLCPVQCFINFNRVCSSSRLSLLVHADKLVLSHFQFVAVFRNCLMGLGLVAKEYSSHSFRISAATEAARCRLDNSAICRIEWCESDFRCILDHVWFRSHTMLLQAAGSRY